MRVGKMGRRKRGRTAAVAKRLAGGDSAVARRRPAATGPPELASSPLLVVAVEQ